MESYKRDMLFASTFSVTDISEILNVSDKNIQNICSGKSSKIKLRTIKLESFDKFVPENIDFYKKEKVELFTVSVKRNSIYRVTFVGLIKILSNFEKKFDFDNVIRFHNKKKNMLIEEYKVISSVEDMINNERRLRQT